MQTIIRWDIVGWFLGMVVLVGCMIEVKGCVDTRTQLAAAYHDCLSGTLGGRHMLQKMPISSQGIQDSAYVIMADGKSTFSFDSNGTFYVQSLPSSIVKIALDLSTKHPWVEFEYTDQHNGDCSDINMLMMWNVRAVKLHCAAKDFPHTIR